jgi:hypothetical protein
MWYLFMFPNVGDRKPMYPLAWFMAFVMPNCRVHMLGCNIIYHKLMCPMVCSAIRMIGSQAKIYSNRTTGKNNQTATIKKRLYKRENQYIMRL